MKYLYLLLLFAFTSIASYGFMLKGLDEHKLTNTKAQFS
jgi:hypothetical protein